MEKNNKLTGECLKTDYITGKQTKIDCKSLNIEETNYRTLLNSKFENRKFWNGFENKQVKAFIPGTIRSLNIKQGQEVKKGESALILEAMKMNNVLIFPKKGKVKNILVSVGQTVVKDQILVELE